MATSRIYRPISRHNRQQRMAALAKQINVSVERLTYFGGLAQTTPVKRAITTYQRILRRDCQDMITLLYRPVELDRASGVMVRRTP